MSRPARLIPLARVVGLAVNVILGVALIAVGLFATDAAWQVRLVLALYGACWLATMPLVVRAWWGHPPTSDRVRTTSLDGRPATVIDFDPVPLRGGVFVTGWLTAVTALASVLGLAAGARGGPVLGLCLAAFFALPLVDLLLVLRRGAYLGTTTEELRVRDLGTETAIAWADVAEVDVTILGGRPHLRVTALPGTHSWHGRRLAHVWPHRPRLRPGVVLVGSRAVEPHTAELFTELCRWARDPSTRTDIGTPDAERHLQRARVAD